MTENRMTHWRIVSLVAAATFIISGGAKTLSQEQQPAKPLPRVLLIGDSIRGGYGKGVQQLLAGKAEVSLNAKNAQYTGWGLKKIDEWLGDGKWDIIHFNWGLWDMYGWEYFNEDRSPAKYEERLDLLVSRLKKTGAKLIWATTTPACPEPEKAMRDRFNRQVQITPSVEKEYQDAALRVMKKHQVAVNDLHALMLPDLEKFQLGPDNVHFNEDGCEKLAQQVAKVILQQLDSWHTRPNIIFIFADDWGWGDLGCHGSTWLKTPNLDRLASEGTDFQQFNVLNPVCSPSRTAALTGMYPARFSVHQHFADPAQNHQRGMPDWLDTKAPTLPRFLKQAGYRTAHFGKWHLTNAQTEGAPKPEAYGYDEALVFNGGAGWESADLHATAANTVAYIKANKTQPFFINAWIHESHPPHVPTPESMEKWKHLDAQKQVYAAVITDGDNAVGTILDALKAEGLEDNTIVMFSSDNGPEHTAAKDAPQKTDPDAQVTGYDTFYSVGETGGMRGRKRSLFEGGVRVPFIVRWPGHTTAGAKNDATAFSAVDLLPTLCAAAGVTLPADYKGDGENLLEAFNGKAVPRTRPIFWQWLGMKSEPDYWPRLAVREGDWKLVMTDDAQRVELHHLTHDRAEANDVSKGHPEIVTRLTKLALDWKATLPTAPNPESLSKQPISAKPRPPFSGATGSNVPPEVRARAFTRWDTNKDAILTLEEYQTGLKGQADLDTRFKNFDKDGDGKLTREEFIGNSAK